MTDEAWRPLGVEGLPEFEGLTDGVPPWLAESFWAWVQVTFQVPKGSGYNTWTDFNISLLRRAERICRFHVGYVDDSVGASVRKLRAVVSSEGLELRLADYLLASGAADRSAAAFDQMLEEAGSLWTVGTRSGKAALVKRVEEGVQTSAEHTMTTAGRAGERLAEAWTAAYGLSPDPSRAYALAVKAVEDAAIPVVLPNDQSATLGKVIARLRDVPFRFAVPRERDEVTSRSVLHSMLKLLWNGQGDRHGGLPDASVNITREDAEAAVLMAVPLVQLFASGAVAAA